MMAARKGLDAPLFAAIYSPHNPTLEFGYRTFLSVSRRALP
jgi:hypothetical protein